MTRPNRFDTFISYSSIDSAWATRLKEALEARELRVWMDADQIRAGDVFVGSLETGIEQSNTLVLVVSPESLSSNWVREEYARAMALVNNRALRLIPIILRDAALPGFLASRQHVDFRDDLAFEANVDRLVSGIEDIPSQLIGVNPNKRRCILDRRLATMLAAIAQRGTGNATETRELDAIGIAVSMFEAVLIENNFGSAIAAALAKSMPALAEAVVFLEPLDDDPTIAGIGEDAAAIWTRSPELQVLFSQYANRSGRSGTSLDNGIAYLDLLIRMARRYDAAIVPHPDRWPLLRWCFDSSLWAETGRPGRVLVSADSANRLARQDRVAAVLGSLVPATTARLIRYGPLFYPYPSGLLTQYDHADLESIPTIVYEILAVQATSHAMRSHV